MCHESGIEASRRGRRQTTGAVGLEKEATEEDGPRKSMKMP